MSHRVVKCICGITISQCRCPGKSSDITIANPCTHGNPEVRRVTPDSYGESTPVRYLIFDTKSESVIHSAGGLAFSIGVAIIEANQHKDEDRSYKVCHPNGVILYHVGYRRSGYGHVVIQEHQQ